MEHGLMLAAVLFSLGLAGVLVRRNIIFMLLSVEIMLNAAGLAFVVAGARWAQPDGQIMFLLLLTMAAAEVAVGLALVLNLYRHFRVVRMQVKAERIISDLFNSYRAEPLMLPDSAQYYIEKRGLERTICDYIAGMTDRYAIEEYQKLFNPLEKP
mgnify:CR=1 FL=1